MIRASLVLLLLGPATGCAMLTKPAVRVVEVGADVIYDDLNAHVLHGGKLSEKTLEALHFAEVEEIFEEDPDQAIRTLHELLLRTGGSSGLYALSELSYWAATKLESREHYLAAAVYAYLYLLHDEPTPFDRRFRWACDIYNRGIHEAFTRREGRIVFTEARYDLPVGSLDVSVDRSRIPWDEGDARFLAADDYRVYGLSYRMRESGLGTPLIAMPTLKADNPLSRFKPDRFNTPVTAFLRISGSPRSMEEGLAATLELYPAYDSPSVQVAGKSLPLETDFSTTLAYGLGKSDVWDFSVRGFFGGGEEFENKILLTEPYTPGRVPIVFVHGTASNPARWAEMFNALHSDPILRERTQPWLFMYSTGNPIAFSAATLREALYDIVATLDPEGKDEALRNMILIGHSQGGLLVRMQIMGWDGSWVEERFGQTLEEFELEPEIEDLVRRSIDFEPMPYVKRVVFISTPHRGSYVAGGFLARMINKLVDLPSQFRQLGEDIFKKAAHLPADFKDEMPTSVDNMKPDSAFIKRLNESPMVPDVKIHSIIPVNKGGPLRKATDGVVKYKSAHLDNVDSEFTLRSGHSCQDHPKTILEVWRIIREHLGQPIGLPQQDPAEATDQSTSSSR